jgi:hypothetical protein
VSQSPSTASATIATTSTRSPLSTFWEHYAFSIGDASFQWLDVVLAAMARGDWARFERRLTEGLCCAARAAAEDVPPPEAAIDEAAAAFRYERDLISGSDISEWLARVQISAEDWMAYITRDVLRQMWADEIEELLDRYPPSPRQLEAAAIAEGISSGLFDLFEASFSERAATAFDACPDLFAAAPTPSLAHTESATRLVRQHAHWLTMCPEAESVARVTRILGIDEAYRVASEQLVSAESLQHVIEAHRLQWVVIDLDTITFADDDAAREALLCMKEDGLSMQDVGALSHQPVTRDRRFLEDVPAEHRDHLLSVEPGRLIGPLPVDGRDQVAAVLARTTPRLDDDHVAQRARVVLLEQAGRRAARDHVKRHPA